MGKLVGWSKKFLSMPAFNFETGSNKQGWQ